MVVWTPSQWERELDNFAARVRAKDYDRIPYTNWQTVFGFTKLNPSKKNCSCNRLNWQNDINRE